MNKKQQDIIIGSMLGDASINTHGGMTFVASIKHLDYLEWKNEKLLNLGARDIGQTSRKDERYDRVYTTCRFYLGGQHIYRNWFYPDHKKVIPPDLVLNPMIFAVWFLDDGTCVNRSGFSIATNAFPPEDVRRIAGDLELIGIRARRTKNNRIYISARSKGRVVNYVEPIICPSMLHKLDVRGSVPTGEQVSKKCPACQQPFLSYASAHQTYCSRYCAAKARPSGYDVRTRTKQCPICGDTFLVYNKTQRTCPACFGKPFPDEVCAICGQAVKHRGRKYCSYRCSVIGCHQAQGHRITAEI